ncbi:MAG TPA: [FeFe] hydrogenase H-cluster radical SAM maturase HydE [Synergistaceae bacterium]|nr:[FeFe] hydrogenase H-cluster radical SAM maturase HydE [Synergistaceae bacterium]NLL41250.1 [FeFe] hydrogenase H-cluster radical SAM maturase HydE [Synergistaceae bacterium]HPX03140.1 [FeFe] hydrogenase H-cluster radical SAM maturase HydE [Synergistaceae bacterium]HQA54000.1 [FeFe] hydrogenase H-cluster radical SAM maturase HydE [Synergistaceae bacterium]
MDNMTRIDCLAKDGTLPKGELIELLSSYSEADRIYAAERARKISLSVFGRKIYTRGLIEISNYCRNDCYYCGIRRSNTKAVRYRLSLDEIYYCCDWGYGAGFRTFVLQGGEDSFFTDDLLVEIISRIKEKYSDCAITLSLGEKERASYQRLFDAGADRYLLRHETANETHYCKLHPSFLTLANRKRCLYDLKEIGFQTGCGLMVGSPFQTREHLAEDLLFMKEFGPHMVGIGPFIPHSETPFRDYQAGSAEDSLFMVSLVRLMHPRVLLPATTALGTVRSDGREQGILAGANVVMPNLSPLDARKNYLLYDNKIGTADDASESLATVKAKIESIGYEMVVERGDYK